MYPQTKNELLRSRLLKVRALQTDRHTDRCDHSRVVRNRRARADSVNGKAVSGAREARTRCYCLSGVYTCSSSRCGTWWDWPCSSPRGVINRVTAQSAPIAAADKDVFRRSDAGSGKTDAGRSARKWTVRPGLTVSDDTRRGQGPTAVDPEPTVMRQSKTLTVKTNCL